MNILTVDNITKSYGERSLFDHAGFYLQEGEKVGIIGVNGTGKSTLLKIIAGLEEPDEGTVIRANNTVVQILPQNPVFQSEETVIEAVLRDSRMKVESTIVKSAEADIGYKVERKSLSTSEFRSAKADMGFKVERKSLSTSEFRSAEADMGYKVERKSLSTSEFKSAEADIGYRNEMQDKETDAKTMLTRLGVTDFDQKCGQLSGGQRKRLALVSVLLSPAEILVLDEPTNHLDNEMADWLEDTLRKRKGAVVMVTHDRYFLDSVSQRIIEIDKGNIYSYDANYSGYLELKMQREEMEEASQRKRQSVLKNELAWVMRGARARSTKQKARLERFEELKNEQGPVKDGQVVLGSVASRLGRTTVELEGISKSYGENTLVKDFTYIFLKDDRVGFIGKNGSGKTTLMKIIAGMTEPDEGTVLVGQTVKIGYYAQEIGMDTMDPGQRVIDYVRDGAEYIETPEGKITASRMLERFLFSGEDQYGILGKLSGGERRRLHLLRILMESPNVLILDEPTNDLDIATLRVLEEYLDEFPGIVIVVSHDRYFLDRTVRRIFALEEDGRVAQYEGGYSDYAARLLKQEQEKQNGDGKTTPQSASESQEPGKNWKTGQKKKLRFTFQEQKDYETIEGDIAMLEKEIEELDEKLHEFARDFVKLNEVTAQKEKACHILEEKMERWMYLEELAGRIEAGELAES